jgi:pimeloyl-ACP methyl ester carboxylesterase
MKSILLMWAFAFLATTCLAQAQDISGTWQGADKRQHVLRIYKAPGGFRGDFYNLGPEVAGSPTNGNAISSIRLDGRQIKFAVDKSGATFDGTLLIDDKSISGDWKTRGPAQKLTLNRVTAKTAWTLDPSPHKVQSIPVDKDVRLEVLDWGGNGPPLLFLPGLGNTAHVFDTFAPKFTDKHHVYGITRRGIGASSTPPPNEENYDADRLGDDVLAVVAALKLDRPVLAGHSIAGEELSSIGSRHPEKVAGLVYLDAAFEFAFYAPEADTINVDLNILRRDLERLPPAGVSPSESRALIDEIESTFPRFRAELEHYRAKLEGLPEFPPIPDCPQQKASNAILAGARKYTVIKGPVLAIAAVPHACAPNCETVASKEEAAADVLHADGFEKGVPTAHMVRLPYANHNVFRSNEADVLREMNKFMEGLDKTLPKSAN